MRRRRDRHTKKPPSPPSTEQADRAVEEAERALEGVRHQAAHIRALAARARLQREENHLAELLRHTIGGPE